jgi:hypothetical protein
MFSRIRIGSPAFFSHLCRKESLKLGYTFFAAATWPLPESPPILQTMGTRRSLRFVTLAIAAALFFPFGLLAKYLVVSSNVCPTQLSPMKSVI